MTECLGRLGDYKRVFRDPFKKNAFSLEVATRMTLEMIPKKDSDSKNLLYFLGCLPGGVGDDMLQ